MSESINRFLNIKCINAATVGKLEQSLLLWLLLRLAAK